MDATWQVQDCNQLAALVAQAMTARLNPAPPPAVAQTTADVSGAEPMDAEIANVAGGPSQAASAEGVTIEDVTAAEESSTAMDATEAAQPAAVAGAPQPAAAAAVEAAAAAGGSAPASAEGPAAAQKEAAEAASDLPAAE